LRFSNRTPPDAGTGRTFKTIRGRSHEIIENGELKIENVLQKFHFQFSTSSFQFTEIESGKAPAEWP